MDNHQEASVEERLRALEDRNAICQLVCGYGYAVDGRNAEAVASLYAEDGVYVVDSVSYEGRKRIAAITGDDHHVGRVTAGCAHISTPPYVVLDGDRAVATCHTMVIQNGDRGWVIDRLRASRLELSRKPGGGWQIDHRQNRLQNGDAAGPALLARLMEGPGPA